MPLDFDGHGTHVTGTVGQLTNDSIGTAGVAFNVKMMPVKVIDGVWDFLFGSPNVGTDDVVARGIRYAADNGAKVINMSIGRTGPPNTSPVVEDAIRYAVSKGVFVAIAAGNEFEQGNPLEVIAEIASRVDGAVSVAAVDRNRGARVLLEHRELRGVVGAGRIRTRLRPRRLRVPADVRLQLHRHVPAAARAVHGARASTSSPTSATSGPRWPRRTSPVLRRC